MTAAASERSERFCRGCGHSLRGIDSRRCPECGRGFDPNDPRTTRSSASRWNLEFFAKAARVVIVLLGLSALACFFCSACGYDPMILWVFGILLSPLLVSLTLYATIIAATPRAPLRRRHRTCAFAFPLLIMSIIWSYWPFRLTFLVYRPRLAALAEQVRKGNAPAMPCQVGWFRIVDAGRCEGNIGLQLTGGTGGGTHLVQGAPIWGGRHVWYNTNWEISLGDGWYYVYED